MAFNWIMAPSTVFETAGQEYARRVHQATFLLAQRYAPEIENWMKQNAPWTDRTGNARAALWAEAFDFVDTVVIAFGHGVDYGTFLELANAGNYAVITPALDNFTPKIWNDVQEMLR